jgi:hypothetical protein
MWFNSKEHSPSSEGDKQYAQLVGKFVFYGTLNFITTVTRARHPSLSWARWIHNTVKQVQYIAQYSAVTEVTERKFKKPMNIIYITLSVVFFTIFVFNSTNEDNQQTETWCVRFNSNPSLFSWASWWRSLKQIKKAMKIKHLLPPEHCEYGMQQTNVYLYVSYYRFRLSRKQKNIMKEDYIADERLFHSHLFEKTEKNTVILVSSDFCQNTFTNTSLVSSYLLVIDEKLETN